MKDVEWQNWKKSIKKIDNKNLESTELTCQAREMSHKTKIITKTKTNHNKL
jgi:hypothetical protein